MQTHPLDANLPPPGLPVEKYCLSIWQRSTRQHELLHQGSTDALPEEAECVIIGSGIAGALTAYEILSNEGGPKSVVMLEAREACSGASGRNAGHCRPDAFRGFTAFGQIHGPEQAMKIIEHEKLVLELVKSFVEKHDVDCDFDYCKTFDVIMGQDFKEYVLKSWESYKAAGGKTGGIRFLEKDEARKETRVPGALGAFEWNAANLHPAKLGLSILQMAKEIGLQLYTGSPVTAVTTAPTSTPTSPLYEIHTSRGNVRTPIVVYASNAHTATLLPQLQGLITPTRAQAHKLIPTPPFASANRMLTHTYSLRFSLKHFYSLIQRKSDGTMVLGTSRGIPGLQDIIHKQVEGVKDDSVVSKELEADALKAFESVWEGEWEKDGVKLGEGHEYGWTGVLGLTKDSVPFVGAVPDSAGQFIIAGFNGHGMARIFGCAPGLAKLIRGGSWSETGMPECFEITTKRIDRLRAVVA